MPQTAGWYLTALYISLLLVALVLLVGSLLLAMGEVDDTGREAVIDVAKIILYGALVVIGLIAGNDIYEVWREIGAYDEKVADFESKAEVLR